MFKLFNKEEGIIEEEIFEVKLDNVDFSLLYKLVLLLVLVVFFSSFFEIKVLNELKVI